jgi:redox-sensitive bicupin YhaK (pirin superfamily)
MPGPHGEQNKLVFSRGRSVAETMAMKNETTTATKVRTMKKLVRIHQSSGMHWVGNGFPVRSVFDYNGLGRTLSPFLLLDYAAPYSFPPGAEKRGVGGHPHKGFETVTIAYQGELEHRDSSGGGGKIGPGDVQWMTAGHGIVHEEFHSRDFSRQGGTLQMVQLWVNLRATDKAAKPRYQTLRNDEIPRVELPGQAGTVRVIAGDYAGQTGPAKTFSPINLWDVALRAGQTVELPLPNGHTTALLVVGGEVEVNGEQTARESDLAIFERAGETLTIEAKTEARLLVMDGEPMAEPVVGQGPFVMNSRAEIQQAFEDYQLGRMGELNEV